MRKRINNADQNPDEEPIICKNCLKWSHRAFLEQADPSFNNNENVHTITENKENFV